MSATTLSTIAQLLCQQDNHVSLARLVGDLDAVLERLGEESRRVIWDCDDVAIFDLPGTRILLGWSEDPGHGLHAVLTLSVGPSPLAARPGIMMDHDGICRRLVERVQDRIGAVATLWRQIDCQMSAEWVDMLIDAIPDMPDLSVTAAEPGSMPPETTPEAAAPAAPTGLTPVRPTRRERRLRAGAANDRPDLPRQPQDPDLQRLRAALYDSDAEPPPANSVPIRLAVHAMNATLIVVWLPLGAAAMTHGLLRGEDMRLASRLMVLTGTVGALAQTQWGQQVVQLASI